MTKSLRDQQKARRRDDILRAAATLFAARGYHGTSIAGIAEEMGAPKSAVGYHHFATKQDIAVAIVKDQQERWLKLIDTATAGPGTGLEQFLSILLTAAIDARGNPLAAAAARLTVERQQLGIVLPPARFRWRAIGHELIERSQAEGDVSSSRPADAVVGLILTSSYGVFTAENNGFEKQDTREHLHTLWLDLLRALEVPDPTVVLEHVRIVELPAETLFQ